MHFFIKTLISALVIAGVSELAKRFNLIAAILASLPLTSILALIWLYWDTKDLQKVSELSMNIFWVVVPSLLFFIALPLLIKTGMKFSFAMVLSCAIMVLGYTGYIALLKAFGVEV